jgi:hypothetical protein
MHAPRTSIAIPPRNALSCLSAVGYGPIKISCKKTSLRVISDSDWWNFLMYRNYRICPNFSRFAESAYRRVSPGACQEQVMACIFLAPRHRDRTGQSLPIESFGPIIFETSRPLMNSDDKELRCVIILEICELAKLILGLVASCRRKHELFFGAALQSQLP